MRGRLSFSALILLTCAASAQAQLYKWVGADGKVTYSDTPPPASANRVEAKSLAATEGISTSGFPYELAEATKNFPVTLYTTSDCDPCNEGRSLLAQRGIPFSEKTVTRKEDAEQFRKIGSDGQFPLLQVGRNKERGFEATAWQNALNAAGYPASSRLPSGYRQPQPQALAGDVAAPAAPRQSSPAAKDRSATDTSPTTGNAPPGFRF